MFRGKGTPPTALRQTIEVDLGAKRVVDLKDEDIRHQIASSSGLAIKPEVI